VNDRLVLLFGLPRSGTTWAGKIFDSHPDTLYRHEPDSVRRIAAIGIVPEEVDETVRDALRSYCGMLASQNDLKVVGKAPVFPKSYLGWNQLAAYKLGIGLARIASRMGVTLPVLGAPGTANDQVVLAWKSIESLGRLGILLEALPDARALHIVRHPCGFVASVERGEARNRFVDNSGASEDYQLLEYLLQTQVGRSWQIDVQDLRAMYPEERLAWRWAVFNDKALADTRGSSRVLAFAYERLCRSPVAVARELLAHAGLEWNAQVESFLGASTRMTDQRYYSVFKDPEVAAWRWQHSIDPDKAARIMGIAEKSLTWKTLGYDGMLPPEGERSELGK
jgi:hypothetical protein